MQIKETLRNSFRRGSNFFRLDKSPPKPKLSGKASPAIIQQCNPNMHRIKNQIMHQEAIREQLVAAIEICRSSFECSPELIEAERLLLLSHKKKSNAESELIRIDYDMDDHSETKIGSATLDIRRLEFPLKRSDMIDTSLKSYYVCLCSCRDRVLATAVERCTSDDKVVFEDMKMTFSRLDPQFEIKVELFRLRLPAVTQCSTNERSNKTRIAKRCDVVGASRFHLQGTGRICASLFSEGSQDYATATSSEVKFSSAGRKKLVFMASDEMLLDYYSEIQLNSPQLKGFLFVKVDDEPHWHRRWCWIRGCTLLMSPINKTIINSADLRIVSIFLTSFRMFLY